MKDDDDFKEFLEHARTDMLPKMKVSSMSVVLGHSEPDIKLCVEMGAAILYDKPIIVVYPEGTIVPSNVRRVASAILIGNMRSDAFKREIQETIERVMQNDQRAKQ